MHPEHIAPIVERVLGDLLRRAFQPLEVLSADERGDSLAVPRNQDALTTEPDARQQFAERSLRVLGTDLLSDNLRLLVRDLGSSHHPSLGPVVPCGLITTHGTSLQITELSRGKVEPDSTKQKAPPESTFGQRFSFLLDRLRALGHRGTDKELGLRYLKLASSRVAEYKSRELAPPADVTLVAAQGAGVDPGWLAFGSASAAPYPKGFSTWLANSAATEQAVGDDEKPNVIVGHHVTRANAGRTKKPGGAGAG